MTISELTKQYAEDARRLGDYPCYAVDEVAPRRVQKTHFVWARVATRGTGNLGWWVPTMAVSEEGQQLQREFLDRVQDALPTWVGSLHVLRRLPRFWELADTLVAMGEDRARMVAELPPILSWRQAVSAGLAGICPSIPRLQALQDLCKACFTQEVRNG